MKGKTKLVQAIIPASTATRVMTAARREGISTGAFIRRMLLQWERNILSGNIPGIVYKIEKDGKTIE